MFVSLSVKFVLTIYITNSIICVTHRMEKFGRSNFFCKSLDESLDEIEQIHTKSKGIYV